MKYNKNDQLHVQNMQERDFVRIQKYTKIIVADSIGGERAGYSRGVGHKSGPLGYSRGEVNISEGFDPAAGPSACAWVLPGWIPVETVRGFVLFKLWE